MCASTPRSPRWLGILRNCRSGQQLHQLRVGCHAGASWVRNRCGQERRESRRELGAVSGVAGIQRLQGCQISERAADEGARVGLERCVMCLKNSMLFAKFGGETRTEAGNQRQGVVMDP